jgi:hypothetical protein
VYDQRRAASRLTGLDQGEGLRQPAAEQGGIGAVIPSIARRKHEMFLIPANLCSPINGCGLALPNVEDCLAGIVDPNRDARAGFSQGFEIGMQHFAIFTLS